MKILRCHADGFGILRNADFSFAQNTCIYLSNGKGKSTLAEFIRAMFYGFAGKGEEKGLRSDFQPWQGTAYGGWLEYEDNAGRAYRVERTFGATPAKDTFRLSDVATKRTVAQTEDKDQRLGMQLFGIDSDGFLRSVYVRQGKIETGGNLPGLHSLTVKLSEAVRDVADIGSFDGAMQQLNEELDSLRKPPRSREDRRIENLRREKSELLQRRELALAAEREIPDLAEEVRTAEDAVEECRQRRGALALQEEAKNNAAEYERLCLQANDAAADWQKAKAAFPELPNEETLASLRQKAELADAKIAEPTSSEEVSALRRQWQSIPSEAEIRSAQADKARLDELYAKMQPQPTSAPLPFVGKIGLVLLVLAVAAFGVLALSGKPVLAGSIGGVLCTVGLICFLFGETKRRKQCKEQALRTERLQTEEEELQARLWDFYARYPLSVSDAAYFAEVMRLKTLADGEAEALRIYQKRLAEREDSRREAQSMLACYRLSYQGDFRNCVRIVENALANVRHLGEVAQIRQNAVAEYLTAHPLAGKGESLGGESASLLNAEEDEAQKRLLESKERLSKARLFARTVGEMQEEIEQKEAEIQSVEKRIGVLETTISYLAETKAELSAHYLPRIRREVEERIAELFPACRIEVDNELTLRIADRDIARYSEGLRAAVYTALRYAICRATFPDGFFMILDDPFSELDEENLRWAFRLLDSEAESVQTIYFTCHASRKWL